MKNVVEDYKGSKIILIGHSWGASLALMYLSQNSGVISKTILIGSAPLNDEAAKIFGENIQLRLSEESKAKLQSIKSEFDQASSDKERNTLIDSLWDFIDEGQVPRALEKISDPVVAFHADFDPIPMNETFNFLCNHIKGLKTIEVKKSGHSPWLEKSAQKIFLQDLLSELD